MVKRRLFCSSCKKSITSLTIFTWYERLLILDLFLHRSFLAKTILPRNREFKLLVLWYSGPFVLSYPLFLTQTLGLLTCNRILLLKGGVIYSFVLAPNRPPIVLLFYILLSGISRKLKLLPLDSYLSPSWKKGSVKILGDWTTKCRRVTTTSDSLPKSFHRASKLT